MAREASIIGMGSWLQTAPGRYLLSWEQRGLDEMVADAFGFHALQLGLPEIDALRANRMPHRWVLGPGAGLAHEATHEATHEAPDERVGAHEVEEDEHGEGVHPAAPRDAGRKPRAGVARRLDVCSDFDALPFAADSIDLVVLPHALEFAADPHLTLREVERVLRPEGRIVIAGFNPTSLWGLRQRLSRQRLGMAAHAGEGAAPRAAEFIGYWRLRDWLRLLGFALEGGQFGCWRPPLRGEAWLARFQWMDEVGERWWPVLGGAYLLHAVKRVKGMRLVGLARAPRRATRTAAAALTPREGTVARQAEQETA